MSALRARDSLRVYEFETVDLNTINSKTVDLKMADLMTADLCTVGAISNPGIGFQMPCTPFLKIDRGMAAPRRPSCMALDSSSGCMGAGRGGEIGEKEGRGW